MPSRRLLAGGRESGLGSGVRSQLTGSLKDRQVTPPAQPRLKPKHPRSPSPRKEWERLAHIAKTILAIGHSLLPPGMSAKVESRLCHLMAQAQMTNGGIPGRMETVRREQRLTVLRKQMQTSPRPMASTKALFLPLTLHRLPRLSQMHRPPTQKELWGHLQECLLLLLLLPLALPLALPHQSEIMSLQEAIMMHGLSLQCPCKLLHQPNRGDRRDRTHDKSRLARSNCPAGPFKTWSFVYRTHRTKLSTQACSSQQASMAA